MSVTFELGWCGFGLDRHRMALGLLLIWWQRGSLSVRVAEWHRALAAAAPAALSVRQMPGAKVPREAPSGPGERA
jgi:hypothetical protein